MKVNIINKSKHGLPSYSTTGSSGMDLRANLPSSNTIIKPFERVLIPTGLFLEIPNGYEAQIRPRSGLALNYGITVLNTPGTIDADFRGEIKVILINLSDADFEIKDGDRICQIVFSEYTKVLLNEVDILSTTYRDNGGFGHTGLK